MPISSMYHSVLVYEPVNCVYFYESTLMWKPEPICCKVVSPVVPIQHSTHLGEYQDTVIGEDVS